MTKLVDIDLLAADVANNADMAGQTGNIAQTCPKVTLEVGLFFDGTLNNRFNVALRNREDDSYQAALTNPALLWALYKNGPAFDVKNSCGGTDRAFSSIYIEGTGSLQNEADDMIGYGTGMGKRSGVESRVLQGFERLLREIGAQGGPPSIKKVVLDVFGFSRGATAARYFVNCIRARRIRYDPVGRGDFTAVLPEDLTVEIRFLGIFDTVAALGVPFNDNNGDVNVHLKTAQVTGQIYHLVASEEYRLNFRLNRNWEGGGDYDFVPGAHSDVGGGSAQGQYRSRHQVGIDQERQQAILRGLPWQGRQHAQWRRPPLHRRPIWRLSGTVTARISRWSASACLDEHRSQGIDRSADR